MSTVTLKDFCPWNQWDTFTEREFDPIYIEDITIDYHKDLSTKKNYLYQSKTTLRIKCLALIVWTVAAHAIRNCMRLFSMVTLYKDLRDFDDNILPLKSRIKMLPKDALRVLASPALVLALEASAFYAQLNPFDGRKLYASCERLAHENFGMVGVDLFGRTPAYCAPCFQPNPTHHGLGGDVRDGEAW